MGPQVEGESAWLSVALRPAPRPATPPAPRVRRWRGCRRGEWKRRRAGGAEKPSWPILIRRSHAAAARWSHYVDLSTSLRGLLRPRVIDARKRLLLVGRGRRHLHAVQRREIAVVDLRGDLIAGFDFAQDLGLVNGVGHRHRHHPPFDVLAVDGQGLRLRVYLLDLAAEWMFLLCRLLRQSGREGQGQHHPDDRDKSSALRFHAFLHPAFNTASY